MTAKSGDFYIFQIFKTALGSTHSYVTWEQEVLWSCKATRTWNWNWPSGYDVTNA